MVSVITYRNKDSSESEYYAKSLNKWKYNYMMIGLGQEWSGFMTKIHGYFSVIKDMKDEDVICITDAYDVLANGPPDELLKKYNWHAKGRIVVGAESACISTKSCIPLDKYWEKLKIEERPPLQYLNSGFFMGSVKSINKLLEYILESGNDDDQYAFCEYVNKHPEEIFLDTECNFVGNITVFDSEQYECVKGRIKNIKTDRFPCFVHVPGTAGDLQQRYINVGECILQEEYVKPSLVEKFQNLWNFGKARLPTWIFVGIFFALVLTFFRFLWGIALFIIMIIFIVLLIM